MLNILLTLYFLSFKKKEIVIVCLLWCIYLLQKLGKDAELQINVIWKRGFSNTLLGWRRHQCENRSFADVPEVFLVLPVNSWRA